LLHNLNHLSFQHDISNKHKDMTFLLSYNIPVPSAVAGCVD
jgi:hypothetical protein